MDPMQIAEDAQAYLPARTATKRMAAADIVLRHVPHSPYYWYGSATRPRFDPGEVDRRIDDVHDWFRARGRSEFMWMIGPSATPSDLVERLIARGAVPDPEDPVSTAMILRETPPPVPDKIDVRRVETFEDYERFMRITLVDSTPEQWEETRSGLEAAWAEARVDDRMYGFLASIDGEPVAMAQLVWLDGGLPYLGGALTLPAARGRGAFRALVRARWDEVVRRGVPVMLVQAGRLSRPILEGMGFVGTARIDILRDGTR